MQKLKLFSDRSLVPPHLPHTRMLYPFWGLSEMAEAGNMQRFERYREVGTSLFELTALEESDVAVLPFDWEFTIWSAETRDQALAFVTRAQEAGKPVVIFYESDLLEEVPVENSLLFGASLHRSRRTPRDFALPGWTEDLVTKYLGGKLDVRRKRPRPTVGFCGYAPPLGMPLGKGKIKESVRWILNRTGTIRYVQVVPGSYARVQALRLLQRSPHVDTTFMVRPYTVPVIKHGVRPNRPSSLLQGSGPGTLPSTAEEMWPEVEDRRGYRPALYGPSSQSQLEFVQNLLESDYVLCARGYGNYSHRLYETLACGRIPLFIDTDCVLPFDFAIDWKRFGVWVDEVDLRSVADRVAEFHASISAEEFEELQVACRRLWEEWLSPEAFFANFHRHLDVMDLPGRNR
jgi:Exostosin family